MLARRLPHALGAQGDRLDAGAHRAQPRRAARACCSRSPTASSCCSRRSSSRPARTSSCSCSRRCWRSCRRSRRGRSCRSRPSWCSPNINAGLLYILAITSMGVYGVIIAGWASNSKYAFLGAMRSAAQIVSYEIAMGFALVGVLMVSRQPEPVRDRRRAGSGASRAGAHLPVVDLAAAVSAVPGLSHLAASPRPTARRSTSRKASRRSSPASTVEYSGMAFALFFLAEYVNMILISTLTRDHVPRRLALAVRRRSAAIWLPPFGWLLLKIFVVVSMFLWFRATFPRYRYDQIMRLGWKVFIPVTLVWIVVLGAWMQTPSGVWWRHDARVREFFRTFLLLELVKGMTLTGRHLFARKITVQFPEEKTPQQPALPRPARAAPLSRTARSAASPASCARRCARRSRSRIESEQRAGRHAPHHALRHRPHQVHLLRLLRGSLPGRLDRRDAHPRVPRREARRPHLHQADAARGRRPLRGADREGPGGGRRATG